MNRKYLGAVVATAVAGFFFAANCTAEETTTPSTATAKVKCSGINECAGKGACSSADNACAGKNGCKGKGWVVVGSEKECTDKGGTVVKS